MLKNKTAFITGASRGIGKAIALALAQHGVNIAIVAKSTEENNTALSGTIYSAASEIEAKGAKALAIKTDIRHEEEIINALHKTVETFGGIDFVINNASAIALTNTANTGSKKFDLMHQINVRGTFLVVQHALPFLAKSTNAHILTLSPPLPIIEKWLSPHIAYSISKYNMSLMAKAWSNEFKSQQIASNTLWPKTTIDTAAVRNLLGGEALARMSRTPQIVADAALHILQQPASVCTGNHFIDEDIVLQFENANLNKYAVDASKPLYPDLFL
jgi:citronellol/citronellal dehydrogenase